MFQNFRAKLFSTILLIVSNCISVSAQNQIVVDVTGNVQDITFNSMLYVEQGEGMSVSEITEKDFQSVNKNRSGQLYLPFSNNTHWLKWEFENDSGVEQDYIIQLKNELVEYMEMYEFVDSLQQFTKTGYSDFLTAKKGGLATREPIINFKLKEQQGTEIYLRLRTQRGLVISAIAFPKNKMSNVLTANFGRMSFIDGALAFRLLLILLLGFFIVKIRAFRAYSFHVLLKTIGYWGLINFLGPRLTDNPLIAQKIDYVTYTLNPYGIVLLSYVLLPMKKLPGWLNFFFIFIVLTTALNHICVIYDYSWAYLQWGIIQLTFYTGFTIALFAYVYYKRLEVQYYYAIPFLIGIGSYFLLNIRVLTRWDIPLVDLVVFILFVAEILVFILFLGKIFRDNESAKLAISRDLLIKEQQAIQLKELDELKNRFFTNISHELKTPLTLIAGPIQELAERSPDNKLLKLVKVNIKRLQELMSQLLDIQRLEAGKEQFNFEVIDLPRHLRVQIFSFESMAVSKGIRLSLEQNREEFEACVDVDKLNKIIDNLLSNAIKYSGNDTNISVNVTYQDNPCTFKFQIIDEGYGISERDLPHIFDRFYQVENNNYQGSGVGLTLVNELTKSLKGNITVTSKVDFGTKFTVTLPVDKEDWKDYTPLFRNIPTKEEDLQIEESNSVKDSEKELVLVVDDNLDMQQYLKLLLEDNYEVITAGNGQEGIEKANQEIPDLIISDLMMPLMDGFEFSRQIKNQVTSSHVPIVMLTAKDTKESKLKGLEIGVDHFLAKPFDADELKLTVRKSIDNRKQLKMLFGKENTDSLIVKNEVNSIEEEFLNSITDVLEKHYANTRLTVGDIAQLMSMSEKQLRRKLKAVKDISTLEYIRKFRLQKAADLLKNSSSPVAEIAFATGFENHSYFTKMFHQEYGKLPSEYAF